MIQRKDFRTQRWAPFQVINAVLIAVFFLGIWNCGKETNAVNSTIFHESLIALIPTDTIVYVYDSVRITPALGDDDTLGCFFLWSFDNVNFDTTHSFSKVFVWDTARTGTHLIYVKILHNDRLCGPTRVADVTVHLGRPTVMLHGAATAFVNDTVNIAAAGFDSNGHTISYLWAVDSLHFSLSHDSIKSVSWAAKDTGQHTVFCKVMDDDSLLSAVSNLSINIKLQHPSIMRTTPDTTVFLKEPVVFTVNAEDKNNLSLKYLWSTDGLVFDTTSVPVLQFVFNVGDTGIKVLYVKVLDDFLMESSIHKINVTVQSGHPTAELPTDTTEHVNDSMAIRAIAQAGHGKLTRYLWSRNGVRFDTTQDSVYRIKWLPSNAGINNLYLKVTDDRGLVSLTSTMTITVKLWRPTVKIMTTTDTVVYARDTVCVRAKGVDGNGPSYWYLWSLDGLVFDSTSDSTFKKVWNITDTGVKNIYVKMADSYGTTSPLQSIQAIVMVRRPTVKAMIGDTTISVNQVLYVPAAAQDMDSIAWYLWSYDGVNFDTTRYGSFWSYWDSTKAGFNWFYVKAVNNEGIVSITDSFSVIVHYLHNEIETENIPYLTKSYIRGLKTYTDTAQLRNQILSIFHGSKRHLFDQIPVQLDSVEQLFILCNILSHKTAPYGHCIETYNVWALLNSPILKCDAYAALAAQLFRIAMGPAFDSSFAFWGTNNTAINLNHCIPFIVRNKRSILVDPTYGTIGFFSKDQLLAGNIISQDSVFSFYSYWNDPAQSAIMASSCMPYRNALMNGLYQSANTSTLYYYIGFDFWILNQ